MGQKVNENQEEKKCDFLGEKKECELALQEKLPTMTLVYIPN